MAKKRYPFYVVLSMIFLGGILLNKPIRKGTTSNRIKKSLKGTDYEKLTPYIIAQAKTETAGYTSRLYVQQNNLFGMKNASRREQLGSEITGTPFRKYYNLDQCVRDLVLWLEFTNFPTSVISLNQYVSQLKKRSYFEEPIGTYLELMKSYYE